jgi:hypothetical protein
MKLFDGYLKKFTAIFLIASLAVIGGMLSVAHAPNVLAQGSASNLTVVQPNYRRPALTATATSQTLKDVLPASSYCTINLTGVALTTVTFQFKVSNDGGVTYYPLSVAPYAASGALVPVTAAATATAAGLYVANVAGFTNYEILTSGTFTATSVSWNLTCTSNKGLL